MDRCNHDQLGILVQTSCTITPQVKPDNVPDLTHTDLTSSQRHQLKQLIQRFPTTHPGAKPTNSQPYRMAPLKQAHASTAVDDMLHDDVISSSSSPWVAPVVLALKKQVEMDPESRAKTAFVTPRGLFELNVMPFGLCNAPVTFQRLMDIVLAGLK
ncbi:unnamed protein product [Didymodactylos carnosus]|uniref:Reverse transcriptase domain-containing protein n=1 Tax=Didymodactylos carnosus TaxID=1234261 RepID=A0A815SG40_9BILA|nr:unnamed protein product [Didymodactylos carnosus]CAF1491487.1 unnamed protein product [Didymodactylos carnosus]CAF3992093.1 unnamed protein product [Didymodactylos carnosus]CAF4354501.1 unnamed protein product [Didymodactylos carnosus]